MNLEPKTVLRIKYNLRWTVWQVTGIHLGGANQEDLISLRCLSLEPGNAWGQSVKETVVPTAFIETNPNVEQL